ncbi:MAG: sodium:solute symporter family protein [Rhodocyclaceae bacterium]|jgi:SSS family solute:Na+ symporter|nr:sodium:solute symporter family protein [Rhodocyclaceae bacterium]MCE2722493.1 sodium:solute symporter family protein [Betaproteobacteria bacterium]MCA3018132.1 sodium:solute symporter family protein [Rhodocyclaceae bacterium]MCA3023074.1 sodium:solute symporter family protein [Rhodocyclaceae bacterium]MCA3026431.1 sodium:solute symporter family protein [Rhodocyclaceae bacterium]
MTALLAFVVVYLLGTLAIGLYAGTRVKTSTDFALAGRRLPLVMIITTTFATWFGAETVMGISAKFVQGGLKNVVEDPFGASLCLIFVGIFFASRLYKMTLLTIGDYYRKRYGKGVEIFCSVAIILSYLGWVAAQVTAIGLVFNLVSGGAISVETGMVIGTLSVLIYVVFGGMLAIAWTDFIQMIVLVAGLTIIAMMAGSMAGGPDKVLNLAISNEWFQFFPEPKFHDVVFFIAAAITMMLGSIPQQDIFQRVMSAKDAKTASRGAIIGGLCYFAFAFVPMFIVACAVLVMPEESKQLLADDPQKVLPTLILNHMPFFAQVLFFGALLSAVKSTASATLLAPSTSFVENIYKNLRGGLTDKQELIAFRVTLVVFTAVVLTYSIMMRGTPIYEMVSTAYQVTLCGAFVPLVAGLYWKRANKHGAMASIVMGITTWLMLLATPLGEQFPAQLAGVIMAGLGMVVGSLMTKPHEHHAHPANADHSTPAVNH